MKYWSLELVLSPGEGVRSIIRLHAAESPFPKCSGKHVVLFRFQGKISRGGGRLVEGRARGATVQRL